MVIVSMLMSTYVGPSPAGSYYWLRSTFSDSPSSTTRTSDLMGPGIASGCLIGNSFFSVLNGVILINNQSGRSKTYYYIAGQTADASTPGIGNNPIVNFGAGAWSEDKIVTIKISD